MLGVLLSIYNGTYTIFYWLCSVLLFTHFFKKLLNLITGGQDISSGRVMITGCDTGFGYEAALKFSQRGLYVFAGCLTQEGVDRLNGDENFNGMAILMNITKNEDIQNARNLIEEQVGDEGLWCLINNAGVFLPGPIEWMSVEDMKVPMEINLWGAVNVTKTMLPLVKKAHGRIINTTSIAGRVSVANLSSYHMSKYAFEAFSDSLRHEMRPWGVSVHIMEPGFHATSLYETVEKRWKSLWAVQPEEIRASYGEEYIEEILNNGREFMNKALSNPGGVVKMYLHAALSSQPKLRYVIGADANTVLMAIATLPTAVGDFIGSLLTKKTLPAALKKKTQ